MIGGVHSVVGCCGSTGVGVLTATTPVGRVALRLGIFTVLTIAGSLLMGPLYRSRGIRDLVPERARRPLYWLSQVVVWSTYAVAVVSLVGALR